MGRPITRAFQRDQKTPAKRRTPALELSTRKKDRKKPAKLPTRKTKQAKSIGIKRTETKEPVKRNGRKSKKGRRGIQKKDHGDNIADEANSESKNALLFKSADICTGKSDVKENPTVDRLTSADSIASQSSDPLPSASLPTDDNSDDDEEFPSLQQLLSNYRVPLKKKFKRGDVVMVKVQRHPLWPYVVNNVKDGRATLYQFPREFPIPKNSLTDISVALKKLKRYQKDACDLVANYKSKYALDFNTAMKQADAILDGKLNPFADSVVIQEEMIEASSDEWLALENKNAKDQSACDVETLDGEDGSTLPPPDAPAKGQKMLDEEDDMLTPEERERSELLVAAIMSSQTEEYLVKVMRNKVRSWYRAKFLTLEKIGCLANRYRGCFPLQEDEHIEMVFDHVVNVRRKHEPKLCGRNGDSYAMSVLLPEAIKFGLRTVWKLTDNEAERIMGAFPYFFFQMKLEKNNDGQ